MLGKLVELVLFGIAPLALGGLLMPGAALADEAEIVGEVSYRERIALPPNAVLKVQLADVSLADAPASIIAEQTIDPAGQVPIKFALKFDTAAIQPRMTYAVLARITVNDRLWFINDERQSVDPLKPEPLRMMLTKVGKQPSQAARSLFGTTWLVEDIEGRGVIDAARSTLEITQDGRISGRGGCNSFMAEATVEGDTIRIGPTGATFMICPPAIMDQEDKFFDALRRVASYRISSEEGYLFLVDADGNELLRLSSES